MVITISKKWLKKTLPVCASVALAITTLAMFTLIFLVGRKQDLTSDDVRWLIITILWFFPGNLLVALLHARTLNRSRGWIIDSIVLLSMAFFAAVASGVVGIFVYYAGIYAENFEDPWSWLGIAIGAAHMGSSSAVYWCFGGPLQKRLLRTESPSLRPPTP